MYDEALRQLTRDWTKWDRTCRNLPSPKTLHMARVGNVSRQCLEM
jgi:hypothetical protein